MHAVFLQVSCKFCGRSNRMIISKAKSSSPKCGSCRKELFEKFAVIFGYAYILSNPEIPDLVKIGQTAGSIQRRVDQINSATGVPTPFVLEAYFASQNPTADEKLLHAAL